MRTNVATLKRVIREATLGRWIVRAGSQVLVKRKDEPPDAWRPHTVKKVLYLDDSELVKGPSSPAREHTWVFNRDGWMIAVNDAQLFSRPEWKYRRRF